jgi:hypothetical protein
MLFPFSTLAFSLFICQEWTGKDLGWMGMQIVNQSLPSIMGGEEEGPWAKEEIL